MSIFNEHEFREAIRDEIRLALRAELASSPTGSGEYLSVARAAEIASVAPQTIRRWVREHRLGTYSAGRVLRVKRSELEALLKSPSRPDKQSNLSPEELAERDFDNMQLAKKRRSTSSASAQNFGGETIQDARPGLRSQRASPLG